MTGREVLEALGAVVATAIPTARVLYEPTGREQLPPIKAPASVVVLYIDDENTERLDWRQTRRTWVIRGYQYHGSDVDTRTAQDDLDAMRAELEKDETLAQIVQRSEWNSSVTPAHTDASVVGLFTFEGETITHNRTATPGQQVGP